MILDHILLIFIDFLMIATVSGRFGPFGMLLVLFCVFNSILPLFVFFYCFLLSTIARWSVLP